MKLAKHISSQATLFPYDNAATTLKSGKFCLQLLKWIGNKQRFAHEIISRFPRSFRTYYEPFLGGGAVLGTLAPAKAVGSDALKPLVDIWLTLSENPEELLVWYTTRWEAYQKNRVDAYERIKASYNAHPNGADLLFLARSCYGGVVRFRRDGYMSTPVGIHSPISPESMAKRIAIWHQRTRGTKFVCRDFEEVIAEAGLDDLVYCDPPYSDSQGILYGAQEFTLGRLFNAIEEAKGRGAFVALSIDGHKKSGNKAVDIEVPRDLFRHEVMINCGRSMLRRFQMEGKTLETELVADRLLLTW
jgi:DNA adenine methylase